MYLVNHCIYEHLSFEKNTIGLFVPYAELIYKFMFSDGQHMHYKCYRKEQNNNKTTDSNLKVSIL